MCQPFKRQGPLHGPVAQYYVGSRPARAHALHSREILSSLLYPMTSKIREISPCQLFREDTVHCLGCGESLAFATERVIERGDFLTLLKPYTQR